MQTQDYFFNCSKDYINNISNNLYDEILNALKALPKRENQSLINRDILISLANIGWAFDSAPSDLSELKKINNRKLCLTSTTLNAGWHSDFAKIFSSNLVQLEVQFGTVESMFKDFCGFRIAYYERRLSLGIEIVMYDPYNYFSHRKSSVTGMAYFEIARQTLPAIGLNCPIWLIGIKE
jgi:Restriction endonuclease BglII.